MRHLLQHTKRKYCLGAFFSFAFFLTISGAALAQEAESPREIDVNAFTAEEMDYMFDRYKSRVNHLDSNYSYSFKSSDSGEVFELEGKKLATLFQKFYQKSLVDDDRQAEIAYGRSLAKINAYNQHVFGPTSLVTEGYKKVLLEEEVPLSEIEILNAKTAKLAERQAERTQKIEEAVAKGEELELPEITIDDIEVEKTKIVEKTVEPDAFPILEQATILAIENSVKNSFADYKNGQASLVLPASELDASEIKGEGKAAWRDSLKKQKKLADSQLQEWLKQRRQHESKLEQSIKNIDSHVSILQANGASVLAQPFWGIDGALKPVLVESHLETVRENLREAIKKKKESLETEVASLEEELKTSQAATDLQFLELESSLNLSEQSLLVGKEFNTKVNEFQELMTGRSEVETSVQSYLAEEAPELLKQDAVKAHMKGIQEKAKSLAEAVALQDKALEVSKGLIAMTHKELNEKPETSLETVDEQLAEKMNEGLETSVSSFEEAKKRQPLKGLSEYLQHKHLTKLLKKLIAQRTKTFEELSKKVDSSYNESIFGEEANDYSLSNEDLNRMKELDGSVLAVREQIQAIESNEVAELYSETVKESLDLAENVSLISRANILSSKDQVLSQLRKRLRASREIDAEMTKLLAARQKLVEEALAGAADRSSGHTLLPEEPLSWKIPEKVDFVKSQDKQTRAAQIVHAVSQLDTLIDLSSDSMNNTLDIEAIEVENAKISVLADSSVGEYSSIAKALAERKQRSEQSTKRFNDYEQSLLDVSHKRLEDRYQASSAQYLLSDISLKRKQLVNTLFSLRNKAVQEGAVSLENEEREALLSEQKETLAKVVALDERLKTLRSSIGDLEASSLFHGNYATGAQQISDVADVVQSTFDKAVRDSQLIGEKLNTPDYLKQDFETHVAGQLLTDSLALQNTALDALRDERDRSLSRINKKMEEVLSLKQEKHLNSNKKVEVLSQRKSLEEELRVAKRKQRLEAISLPVLDPVKQHFAGRVWDILDNEKTERRQQAKDRSLAASNIKPLFRNESAAVRDVETGRPADLRPFEVAQMAESLLKSEESFLSGDLLEGVNGEHSPMQEIFQKDFQRDVESGDSEELAKQNLIERSRKMKGLLVELSQKNQNWERLGDLQTLLRRYTDIAIGGYPSTGGVTDTFEAATSEWLSESRLTKLDPKDEKPTRVLLVEHHVNSKIRELNNLALKINELSRKSGDNSDLIGILSEVKVPRTKNGKVIQEELISEIEKSKAGLLLAIRAEASKSEQRFKDFHKGSTLLSSADQLSDALVDIYTQVATNGWIENSENLVARSEEEVSSDLAEVRAEELGLSRVIHSANVKLKNLEEELEKFHSHHEKIVSSEKDLTDTVFSYDGIVSAFEESYPEASVLSHWDKLQKAFPAELRMPASELKANVPTKAVARSKELQTFLEPTFVAEHYKNPALHKGRRAALEKAFDESNQRWFPTEDSELSLFNYDFDNKDSFAAQNGRQNSCKIQDLRSDVFAEFVYGRLFETTLFDFHQRVADNAMALRESALELEKIELDDPDHLTRVAKLRMESQLHWNELKDSLETLKKRLSYLVQQTDPANPYRILFEDKNDVARINARTGSKLQQEVQVVPEEEFMRIGGMLRRVDTLLDFDADIVEELSDYTRRPSLASIPSHLDSHSLSSHLAWLPQSLVHGIYKVKNGEKLENRKNIFVPGYYGKRFLGISGLSSREADSHRSLLGKLDDAREQKASISSIQEDSFQKNIEGLFTLEFLEAVKAQKQEWKQALLEENRVKAEVLAQKQASLLEAEEISKHMQELRASIKERLESENTLSEESADDLAQASPQALNRTPAQIQELVDADPDVVKLEERFAQIMESIPENQEVEPVVGFNVEASAFNEFLEFPESTNLEQAYSPERLAMLLSSNLIFSEEDKEEALRELAALKIAPNVSEAYKELSPTTKQYFVIQALSKHLQKEEPETLIAQPVSELPLKEEQWKKLGEVESHVMTKLQESDSRVKDLSLEQMKTVFVSGLKNGSQQAIQEVSALAKVEKEYSDFLATENNHGLFPDSKREVAFDAAPPSLQDVFSQHSGCTDAMVYHMYCQARLVNALMISDGAYAGIESSLSPRNQALAKRFASQARPAQRPDQSNEEFRSQTVAFVKAQVQRWAKNDEDKQKLDSSSLAGFFRVNGVECEEWETKARNYHVATDKDTEEELIEKVGKLHSEQAKAQLEVFRSNHSYPESHSGFRERLVDRYTRWQQSRDGELWERDATASRYMRKFFENVHAESQKRDAEVGELSNFVHFLKTQPEWNPSLSNEERVASKQSRMVLTKDSTVFHELFNSCAARCRAVSADAASIHSCFKRCNTDRLKLLDMTLPPSRHYQENVDLKQGLAPSQACSETLGLAEVSKSDLDNPFQLIKKVKMSNPHIEKVIMVPAVASGMSKEKQLDQMHKYQLSSALSNMTRSMSSTLLTRNQSSSIDLSQTGSLLIAGEDFLSIDDNLQTELKLSSKQEQECQVSSPELLNSQTCSSLCEGRVVVVRYAPLYDEWKQSFELAEFMNIPVVKEQLAKSMEVSSRELARTEKMALDVNEFSIPALPPYSIDADRPDVFRTEGEANYSQHRRIALERRLEQERAEQREQDRQREQAEEYRRQQEELERQKRLREQNNTKEKKKGFFQNLFRKRR